MCCINIVGVVWTDYITLVIVVSLVCVWVWMCACHVCLCVCIGVWMGGWVQHKLYRGLLNQVIVLLLSLLCEVILIRDSFGIGC